MKNYLRTIRERTPGHKKRFALLVSGGITLIIFGLWSLVVFGGRTATVADVPTTPEARSPAVGSNATSPFEDIKGGIANTFDAVTQQVDQIKQTITSVNIENKYQEVRNQALSN